MGICQERDQLIATMAAVTYPQSLQKGSTPALSGPRHHFLHLTPLQSHLRLRHRQPMISIVFIITSHCSPFPGISEKQRMPSFLRIRRICQDIGKWTSSCCHGRRKILIFQSVMKSKNWLRSLGSCVDFDVQEWLVPAENAN